MCVAVGAFCLVSAEMCCQDCTVVRMSLFISKLRSFVSVSVTRFAFLGCCTGCGVQQETTLTLV